MLRGSSCGCYSAKRRFATKHELRISDLGPELPSDEIARSLHVELLFDPFGAGVILCWLDSVGLAIASADGYSHSPPIGEGGNWMITDLGLRIRSLRDITAREASRGIVDRAILTPRRGVI